MPWINRFLSPARLEDLLTHSLFCVHQMIRFCISFNNHCLLLCSKTRSEYRHFWQIYWHRNMGGQRWRLEEADEKDEEESGGEDFEEVQPEIRRWKTRRRSRRICIGAVGEDGPGAGRREVVSQRATTVIYKSPDNPVYPHSHLSVSLLFPSLSFI